jgi:protein SCO1/2
MSSAENTPSTPIKWWAVALLGTAALVIGVWVGQSPIVSAPVRQATVEHLQSATVLNPPRPLKSFALTGIDHRPFKLESLRGQWNFLAIGYTYCPDVCPTTMATFDAIAKQLSDLDANAQFVFISVDPERDTPEKLAQYVRYFNPAFNGATGPHPALQDLTKQLGILYGRAIGADTALEYLVDHSASIMLIDPEARLSAIFSAPHKPSAMAEDFIHITTQRNR